MKVSPIGLRAPSAYLIYPGPGRALSERSAVPIFIYLFIYFYITKIKAPVLTHSMIKLSVYCNATLHDSTVQSYTSPWETFSSNPSIEAVCSLLTPTFSATSLS